MAMALTAGASAVAGLDEAGRGALAGPVFAAAVILPLRNSRLREILRGVNDSKVLTAGRRDSLFPIICSTAVAYGIGQTSAQEIDRLGIISATRQAMEQAFAQLDPSAEAALVDGSVKLKSTAIPQQQVIRGDSLSLSIAAASILAKVSRDRYMRLLELQFPGYFFAQHKGYGTAGHMAAIGRLGSCPEHRLSFAPFRYAITGD